MNKRFDLIFTIDVAFLNKTKTEEEDEEPEKPRAKGGRGNARNTVSKTGRPRRSTAGISGKG